MEMEAAELRDGEQLKDIVRSLTVLACGHAARKR